MRFHTISNGTSTEIEIPDNVKILAVRFDHRIDSPDEWACRIQTKWNNCDRDFWSAGQTPIDALIGAIKNSRTSYYD